MTSTEIAISDLAESVQPLAEHFSIEAAQALIAHFGGTEIYVPMQLRDGHALEVLGADLAQQICNVFGGATLLVPKELMTPAAKQQRAIAMASRHMKTADIARALNLTERHVYKLLAGELKPRRGRKPIDPRQISMLDWLDQD